MAAPPPKFKFTSSPLQFKKFYKIKAANPLAVLKKFTKFNSKNPLVNSLINYLFFPAFIFAFLSLPRLLKYNADDFHWDYLFSELYINTNIYWAFFLSGIYTLVPSSRVWRTGFYLFLALACIVRIIELELILNTNSGFTIEIFEQLDRSIISYIFTGSGANIFAPILGFIVLTIFFSEFDYPYCCTNAGYIVAMLSLGIINIYSFIILIFQYDSSHEHISIIHFLMVLRNYMYA